MSTRLRWGILGTGNIARQFTGGVATSTRGAAVAVASRGAEKAEAFARANGVPKSYAAYDALLADADVDAVYVSLPNSMHHAWTLAALRAGKHVLCEKPFAVTAAEAAEMFDAAGRAGRVVMEAFMYRCHPQTTGVLELVRGGAIGTLKLVRTSFCYRTGKVDDNIRFRPDLAGGALMDIGCYCLSFSRLFAGGEPEAAQVTGNLHPSGVDDFAAGWLRFPGGVTASFTCGMGVQADNTAYVCGTDGYIEVPVPWKPPPKGATYTLAHSATPKMDLKGTGVSPAAAAAPAAPPRRTFTVDAGVDLFGLEAEAFAAAVAGDAPVPVSREDTMGNVRLLEDLRRQLGLAF